MLLYHNQISWCRKLILTTVYSVFTQLLGRYAVSKSSPTIERLGILGLDLMDWILLQVHVNVTWTVTLQTYIWEIIKIFYRLKIVFYGWRCRENQTGVPWKLASHFMLIYEKETGWISSRFNIFQWIWFCVNSENISNSFTLLDDEAMITVTLIIIKIRPVKISCLLIILSLKDCILIV